MNNVARNGIRSGICDRPQVQGIGRTFGNRCIAADRNGRGDVVNRHAEDVGPIEERTVLVNEIDRDGIAVRSVGIGVGLRAGRTVGIAHSISPVNNVARDGICSGIGHRSQVQGIGRVFRNRGIAVDGDGGGDVGDGDCGCIVAEATILVLDACTDSSSAGAIVEVACRDRCSRHRPVDEFECSVVVEVVTVLKACRGVSC